jgi:hypothetical protein
MFIYLNHIFMFKSKFAFYVHGKVGVILKRGRPKQGEATIPTGFIGPQAGLYVGFRTGLESSSQSGFLSGFKLNPLTSKNPNRLPGRSL